MKRLLRVLMCLAAFVAAGVVGSPAFADVPGRVGRIAFLQGDVQAYSETEPEWRTAYVNQPITSRNSLFVGDGGRAEVSVGSTTIALDGASQVDIQQLDDATFAIDVVRGRVAFTVRRIDGNDVYAVAVAGANFRLLTTGRYRVDALDDDRGISVFAGQASLATANGSVLVNAGNALRAAASASSNAPLSFESVPTARVELDDWVVAREARFRDSQTARFVSPNMTGYEDLEANGRWASEPELGPVWYPTTYVDAGWVPYRHGRWAYVAPWGYTWVDDAPWGFAPFHYGRWVEVGGRWGWCPGSYVTRPVYAPALVGFYGGSNVSVSFATGGGPAVGWYPLAPWQRYSPHYTQNVTYINRVNNIVVAEPPARWRGGPDGRDGRDWNRYRGGTVVPQTAFVSQRSISRIAMTSPDDFARRAPSLPATALPRPQAAPVGVRSNDGGRPDFRGRESAGRPFDRERAPQAVNVGPSNGGAIERARVDEASASFEQQRRIDAQRAQDERGRAVDERRRFDEARIRATVPQRLDADHPVPTPGVPPQTRVESRVQPSLRSDGDSGGDVNRNAIERAQRNGERHQEFRNIQRPPQQVPPSPPIERGSAQVAPVERAAIARPPQAIERPQVAAPVQAVPQPAPVPRAPVQREVMRQKAEGNGFDRGPGERGGPGRER